MLFTAHHLSYRDTAAFSKIVLDYIEGAATLQPFYAEAPTFEGIKRAIEKKEQQPVDRAALVQVFREQYEDVETGDAVLKNIEALSSPNTFTICTAHQPNLFTGPLYFIYKILHAVQLATALQEQFQQYRFVPVYYMGSEDGDKDELLHTYINGKKYEWQTSQTGAVGRMKVDASLVRLLDEMAGQLNVLPFGSEIMRLLQQCYAIGNTIQNATFRLVHALFKKFGLLVLIADHAVLKKLMLPVFEDDLFQQTPSGIVEETCQRLSEAYNVQANPREINLFYLADGIRNRIVGHGDLFHVHDTDIRFTAAELKAELQQYPERFSPNVILRGLFQETILPNVAFIGGGGELAYWLQLKDLFLHYQVPYPVLVLRNSILIVDKKEKERIEKWKLHYNDLFQPELHIIDSVLKGQGKLPQLNGEVEQLAAVYEDLKKLASTVDVTLHKHVEALKTGSLRQLQNLQRKLMRAERRKHDVLLQQVQQLKKSLFPNNGLQERMENVSSFYARHGSEFIDEILEHSPALETQFTILTAV